MNGDTLLTIAQIAAGLIGFSAVATMLTRKRTKLHSFYFQALVIYCLLAIWASLIPFWVAEFLVGWKLWHFSLGCVGLLSLPFIPWMIINIREIGFEGFKLKGAGNACKFAFGLQLLQFVLMGVHAAAWPIDPSQIMYEIIVCLYLTMAAFVFVDYVFIDQISEEDA